MLKKSYIFNLTLILLVALFASCHDKSEEVRDYYISQSHDKRLIGKWIILPYSEFKDNSREYFEFREDGRFIIYDVDIIKHIVSTRYGYHNYWYSKQISTPTDSVISIIYQMNYYGSNFLKLGVFENEPCIYKFKGDTLYYQNSNTSSTYLKMIPETKENIAYWDSINQSLPPFPNLP